MDARLLMSGMTTGDGFPIKNVENDGMENDLGNGRNKATSLSLSFGLPTQADIQNALNECLIGHARAFSRLGKIFTIG
jgi:hypothetical protein